MYAPVPLTCGEDSCEGQAVFREGQKRHSHVQLLRFVEHIHHLFNVQVSGVQSKRRKVSKESREAVPSEASKHGLTEAQLADAIAKYVKDNEQ